MKRLREWLAGAIVHILWRSAARTRRKAERDWQREWRMDR